MASPPRNPPRFVPTLTTVFEQPVTTPALNDPLAQPLDWGSGVTPEALAEPVGAEPPLFTVPGPAPDAGTAEDFLRTIDSGGTIDAGEAGNIAFQVEEQLLHRVLQRIDSSLEQRLTDTVSEQVQQHLDAMMPILRGQIESTLRDLVRDSLAAELTENTKASAKLPGSDGV